MWFVPAGPISHVPRPPMTATVTTTATVRARPPSAIVAPSTRNGIVLPIRWPQPACRNGAKAMSGSVSTSRGWMPFASRRAPAASRTSTTHINATIAPTSASPRTRSWRAGVRPRAGSRAVAADMARDEGYAHRLKTASTAPRGPPRPRRPDAQPATARRRARTYNDRGRPVGRPRRAGDAGRRLLRVGRRDRGLVEDTALVHALHGIALLAALRADAHRRRLGL